MTAIGRWLGGLVGATALLLAGPGSAGSRQPDAVLYELTEHMTLDQETGIRAATSAIQGVAKAGPIGFCPTFLLEQLAEMGLIPENTKRCAVTAVASNSIDTTAHPPNGPFQGYLVTIIELDNPVDAPEFEVMRGAVDGFMWVVDEQARLIRMQGTFTVEGLPSTSFTGVFRRPFAMDGKGKARKPRRFEPAFYLMDNGDAAAVRPDERALGYPTVRVEITYD
ncbi:MAG: hypothetical protein ACREMB_01550 [Candidatus Rokuibacteriota bacterium]